MMTRFIIIAVCLAADIILSAIFVTAFWTWHETLVLWIGGAQTVLYLVEIVAMCFFWHRAWRSIQDSHARTTPAKAIGLMFIPLFNLYWAFVLVWGFAWDYNAFCRRHAVGDPPRRLPTGYFLAVVIMWVGSVVLRYLPLIGRIRILLYLRYHPEIGVIYSMCFLVAMLALLYKTTRAVKRLTEDVESPQTSIEQAI